MKGRRNKQAFCFCVGVLKYFFGVSGVLLCINHSLLITNPSPVAIVVGFLFLKKKIQAAKPIEKRVRM